MLDAAQLYCQDASSFKYVIGGRKPPNVDCWGFVINYYKSLGFEIPDYEEEFEKDEAFGFYRKYFIEIAKLPFIQRHDMVLLESGISDYPLHCGIYISPNTVIHCGLAGVTRSYIYNPKFKKRIIGIYRLKDLPK